ncbi:hypothetical protein TrVE_jg669, partial [Triparma verrucosa]
MFTLLSSLLFLFPFLPSVRPQCSNQADDTLTTVSCTNSGFIVATLICDTERYQGGIETCLTTIAGNGCTEEEAREWFEGCQTMCDYCASEYAPTESPTNSPTTAFPTETPTKSPTASPTTETLTKSPTKSPTASPTTETPTKIPTVSSTASPTTETPTKNPTASPTTPTPSPTSSPTTLSPTFSPTSSPTLNLCTSTTSSTSTGTSNPFYCVNGGTISGRSGSCQCLNCDEGYSGDSCEIPDDCTPTNDPNDDGE